MGENDEQETTKTDIVTPDVAVSVESPAGDESESEIKEPETDQVESD